MKKVLSWGKQTLHLKTSSKIFSIIFFNFFKILFLVQSLPLSGNYPLTHSSLFRNNFADEMSLSESVDSSLTAITFTEVSISSLSNYNYFLTIHSPKSML